MVVDEHHDYETVGRVLDRTLLSRLFAFVRPHLRWFLLGLFLLFVITGLELAGPWVLREALSVSISSADTNSTRVEWDTLGRYAIIFASILLAGLWCRYRQFMVLNTVGQKVLHDIRRAVFRKLQELPISYYDRNPSGRLVSRVTTDVETLNEMFTSGAVTLIGDLVKIAALLTALFLIDTRLAMVATIVIPVLALTSAWFRIRARKAYRETRTSIARVTSFLGETVAGIRVFQGFGRENKAATRFAERNHDFLRANLKTVFYFALFFPVVDFLALSIQGATFWGGGVDILNSRLTIPEFLQFWLYLSYIFEPLRELAEKYNVLQSAMASTERVFQVIDTASEHPDPANAREADDLRGAIEFRNVSFAYNADEPVLRDISFSVKAGETVALVGATGSGKTTITALLNRFYEVESGSILVDEHPIEEYRRKALRSRIAYVPQDAFLFTGTVLDNLASGSPDITEDQALAASKAIGAENFIARFPGGYRHQLSERGANISSGERQMISFARALAVDPDILILDEATANVDPDTESIIQKAIHTLLEGRTSLVVAHRLSTIRQANRIIVIHKGEIREIGTHRELLKKKGLYYRLYRLQFTGSEAPGRVLGDSPE